MFVSESAGSEGGKRAGGDGGFGPPGGERGDADDSGASHLGGVEGQGGATERAPAREFGEGELDEATARGVDEHALLGSETGLRKFRGDVGVAGENGVLAEHGKSGEGDEDGGGEVVAVHNGHAATRCGMDQSGVEGEGARRG